MRLWRRVAGLGSGPGPGGGSGQDGGGRMMQPLGDLVWAAGSCSSWC
jgi:hypothetical protein